MLRRFGGILLRDSFGGDSPVYRAIARLLDAGFYLISTGYVLLTIQTGMPMNDLQQLFQILSLKLGCFLLVLGILHLFNMLLLGFLRRRSGTTSAPAAS
jgi:hypothetical protein